MGYEINIYCIPDTEMSKGFDTLNEQIHKFDNLYHNGNKKECFEMYQMLSYFFHGFSWDWDAEFKLDRIDSNFLVSKIELLSLMEWYIALSFVFNSDNDISLEELSINSNYLNQAVILEHKEDYTFFSYPYSLGFFIHLKNEIALSNYSNFILEYSF